MWIAVRHQRGTSPPPGHVAEPAMTPRIVADPIRRLQAFEGRFGATLGPASTGGPEFDDLRGITPAPERVRHHPSHGRLHATRTVALVRTSTRTRDEGERRFESLIWSRGEDVPGLEELATAANPALRCIQEHPCPRRRSRGSPASQSPIADAVRTTVAEHGDGKRHGGPAGIHRRSVSVVPPQSPFSDCSFTAHSRHSGRTGHARQSSLAEP